MKLLIVKLHAIGDLVIATPALQRIRTGLPDARLTVLTTKWTAPAIYNNPDIDRTIEVDNSIFFQPGLKTLPPTIKLINSIRSENFDAAVLFHANRMIDKFIKICGVEKRYFFSSNWINSSDRSVFMNESKHAALIAYDLADRFTLQLGGKPVKHPRLENLRYSWFCTDDEESIAADIIKHNGLCEQEFMVVLPGGGVNPSDIAAVKRWNTDKFTGLCDEIGARLNCKVVLSGGKTDNEICEKVERHSKIKPVNLTGKYSLRITGAILKQAKAVVANDSGPLHIAAATGTPVVGVFGPTGGANLNLPPGKNNYAAELDLPCIPCYFGKFKGCIFDKYRCMEELNVEHVFEKIKKAINY